ncbi:MAG TPA: hypothetical protein VFX35_02060 [Solirubrobacterales bacterium]|nr:hypothetical protein [Solirubrobacterales bacterium]
MSRTFGNAEQKRHALFGDQPLEPLSVRLLQAAGVLSLLLILVVVNSLLNSAGGESPFDPNPVAAAAEQTREVSGMRIEMTMRVTGSTEGAVTITGNGAFNGDTGLGEFTYDASTPKGRVRFDAILGESAWYFRYPQFRGQLPEGKEWVKLEGLEAQGEKDTMGVESPDEMLETVGAAGSVARAGRVKVRGQQTTRYRLTLSPEAALEVLRAEGKTETAEKLENGSAQFVGPIRVEAFIDRRGILRRVRTSSTASVQGQTITSKAEMDFFAFGTEPDIQTPDDSQAFDMGPMLEESLDALGQAS